LSFRDQGPQLVDDLGALGLILVEPGSKDALCQNPSCYTSRCALVARGTRSGMHGQSCRRNPNLVGAASDTPT
jgi:hypothetical protein